MFGSPWHLTSVPEVPSYAFLAPVVAAVRKALEAEQTTSTKSVPAASSVVGGVPRRSCPVCILKRWIWLLLVLVSHQFLLPVSDRLTNCKVGQTLLSLPLCQLFRRRYRMSLLRPQRCGRVFPSSCQQSFVVSQCFSPVPPKLVNPIVSRKFVELSELLSSNIVQTQLDSDPQLFFSGWLVLISMSKKPKRRMDDVGWRPFQCIVSR